MNQQQLEQRQRLLETDPLVRRMYEMWHADNDIFRFRRVLLHYNGYHQQLNISQDYKAQMVHIACEKADLDRDWSTLYKLFNHELGVIMYYHFLISFPVFEFKIFMEVPSMEYHHIMEFLETHSMDE